MFRTAKKTPMPPWSPPWNSSFSEDNEQGRELRQPQGRSSLTLGCESEPLSTHARPLSLQHTWRSPCALARSTQFIWENRKYFIVVSMGTEANRTNLRPAEEISGAPSPCCLLQSQNMCHPDNHTHHSQRKSWKEKRIPRQCWPIQDTQYLATSNSEGWDFSGYL